MTVSPAAASFSSDDGSADPRVVAALDAYESGTGGAGDVLKVLAASRLLVPVVAVLDEMAEDGAGEKSSHMATVSTISRSGRKGLLAFTSVETMKAWDPEARPVPVGTREAAEAALADSADAIVVDLAGPVTFAIESQDLRSLAAGWRSHAMDPGVQEAWAGSSSPAHDPVLTRVARLVRTWLSRRPRGVGRDQP